MISHMNCVAKKEYFQYGIDNFILDFFDSEVFLEYEKVWMFLQGNPTTKNCFLQKKQFQNDPQESSGEAFISIGVSQQNQNICIHALDVLYEALEMLVSYGL